MDVTETRRVSGVTQASVAAMLEWLSTEYAAYSGRNLTTRLVSSDGNLRQAQVQDKEGKKLEYPFALAQMGSVGIDTERLGLMDRTGTRGVMTNRNRTNGFAEFESMRPIRAAFGINFRTASYEDVWLFTHTLLMACPRKRLVIESDEGFRVECDVDIDPELTVPPLESGDAGSNYTYETTLVLRTYMGIVTRHRLIRNIKLSVLDGGEGQGPINERTVYSGPIQTLLERVEYSYHDLFDPASGHNKYATKGPTP